MYIYIKTMKRFRIFFDSQLFVSSIRPRNLQMEKLFSPQQTFIFEGRECVAFNEEKITRMHNEKIHTSL